MSSAFAQDVRLVQVATGFQMPTGIEDPGDGSGRIFVIQQRGQIVYFQNGSNHPFLDISSRVSCCNERGLLGLAFDPHFSDNHRFYVYYTDTNGDLTISRFLARAAGDADPASETVLLKIAHPNAANHNGGRLTFGPDGYLYIGTGDGGGGGDTFHNGQNPNALLAKILRIDVSSGGSTYDVPPTNPFVSRGGFRPEIWAWGLRNPWRFSFDRATGDLYIADVGQDKFEEIDFQPASSGGGENYGWPIMEGLQCYSTPGCNTAGLTPPIQVYSHDGGNCSVTGGFVYRGTRIPAMLGTYIYADFCSGRIWTLRRDSGGAWQNSLFQDVDYTISTFGQDASGELYLADYSHGVIYRFDRGAPMLAAGGVVNAATWEPGLVPGSLASAFGAGITSVTGIQVPSGFPLPTDLAGTAIKVNGVAAPILAVANVNGQEQINFQVPWQTAPGTAQVTVTSAGAGSAALDVPVAAAQPGIFAVTTNGAGQPLTIWATGLGAVSPAQSDGAAAPGAPFALTTPDTQVTIGGRTARILYNGLAPGLAGVFQLNVERPADLASGDYDVAITSGGVAGKAFRYHLE